MQKENYNETGYDTSFQLTSHSTYEETKGVEKKNNKEFLSHVVMNPDLAFGDPDKRHAIEKVQTYSWILLSLLPFITRLFVIVKRVHFRWAEIEVHYPG